MTVANIRNFKKRTITGCRRIDIDKSFPQIHSLLFKGETIELSFLVYRIIFGLLLCISNRHYYEVKFSYHQSGTIQKAIMIPRKQEWSTSREKINTFFVYLSAHPLDADFKATQDK